MSGCLASLSAADELDNLLEASDESDAAADSDNLSPEILNALCVIEGEAGVGSGFFCTIRDIPFAVTNIHVLAGNQRFKILTIDGDEVAPMAIAIAQDHDIALIRVDASQVPETLELMDSPSRNVSLGDRVIVPGNESGQGVVTQVKGKVKGIGPQQIEVDARFVTGNSGSPILHAQTGKVIGVATYLITYRTDDVRNRAGKSDTRWLGYRIDSVKNWEPVAWQRFVHEAKEFSKIERTTDELYAYLSDGDLGDNPDLEDAVAMARRDLSTADNRERVIDIIKTFNLRLNSVATADLKKFRKQNPYDYFSDRAEEHERYRKAVIDFLEDSDTHLRNLRRQ
ncbi:MAG: serine protease [Opitutales bacterium]